MTTENKNTYLQNMEDPFYDTNQIPESLRNDKFFILSACKRNFPSVLSIASEELRDDKELVLHIAQNYSENLFYVSERLKDDKEVVLAFVNKNPESIQFSSERLQKDPEVIHATQFKTETKKNKL